MNHYYFRLYIAGANLHSTRALVNIKAICEERLPGDYELEVIDIYQQPERLKDDHITATPTLMRLLPLPVRTLIGDLSDKQHVLLGLDL